jgi:hypothetical protein
VPAEVGAPPAIQVDARTQQAFLTQAFLWMFVGLGVTAAIAYIVQSNERLLEFAAEQPADPDHRQLALVFVIGSASDGSAPPLRSGCSSSTPRHSASRSG